MPVNGNWMDKVQLRTCLKIHERANRLVINRIDAM